MENSFNKFNVGLTGENKTKDKNVFTFEFKIVSDKNCRIKVEGCQAYDKDGFMHQAEPGQITNKDMIIGNSKYFKESELVNVNLTNDFKSKIGCSIALTITDIDDKSRMNICYQKKSAVRWDMVGVQQI